MAAASQLKLILVPTDLSPGAEPALRLAARIAEATGAEIVLLHVLDLVTPAIVASSPDIGLWMDDAMIQEIQNNANTAMKQLAARLPRARTLIREGMPRSIILDVAQELKADLIVMGTHGRTGLGHVLIGSVAEHLVRYSRIPVLTVRQQDTP
jgi:universal stress protein A